MNKIVFITGGAKGIGAAIAEKFAKDGYNVAVTYNTSESAALELVNKIKNYNPNIIAIKADATVTTEVENSIARVTETFGKIDILVNNAGIAEQKLFTDIKDTDWERMINSNLTSVFKYCRTALPQMISRKSGCIINISSMWGEVGASCEVHYSAAKAGIIGLTKALAKEVGLSNIRVNCITPGVIQTDMLKSFSDEDIAALKDETPIGRIGQPEDVAEAVYFLASDKAGFITGQILGVNGGFII